MKVDTIINSTLHDTTFSIKDTLAIIQVNKKSISPAEKIEAYSKKRFGKKYIYLSFSFQIHGVYSISENDKVEFKSLDDSIITLHNIGSYQLNSGNDVATMLVDVTGVVSKLKNRDLKEIYLDTSNGGDRIILNDRFQRKIAQMLTVLTNY